MRVMVRVQDPAPARVPALVLEARALVLPWRRLPADHWIVSEDEVLAARAPAAAAEGWERVQVWVLTKCPRLS